MNPYFLYLDKPDYKVELEYMENQIYVHVKVNQWGVGVLKDLRKEFEGLKWVLRKLGHSWLFAVGQDEKTVKFWNTICPLTDKEIFGPNDEFILGAWDIEED